MYVAPMDVHIHTHMYTKTLTHTHLGVGLAGEPEAAACMLSRHCSLEFLLIQHVDVVPSVV
jgi:hypothetical protein